MALTGSYVQSGGTNSIGTDLGLWGVHAGVTLTGGVLRNNNAMIYPSWSGQFLQSGGLHVVTNQLTVNGSENPLWLGFNITGGELVVSNIVLHPNALFSISNGLLTQSGTLTMISATLSIHAGEHRFGNLQLQSQSPETNSILRFSPTNNCVVRFDDSRDASWSTDATLTVENWAGSRDGQGAHRVIFGTNAGALTAEQLKHIVFLNPTGFEAGTYTAQILSTGEIVPSVSSQAVIATAALRLEVRPDGVVKLCVDGHTGDLYRIEVSKNLVDWIPCTNQPASGGAEFVMENHAMNDPCQFYRAVLLP
jgi:hypothetical protein